MEKERMEAAVDAVVKRALTEMKCIVLRAQHLHDDIDALKADPTEEMVEAFCQKYDRLACS